LLKQTNIVLEPLPKYFLKIHNVRASKRHRINPVRPVVLAWFSRRCFLARGFNSGRLWQEIITDFDKQRS
jgi:hypothetical protein